MKTPSYLSKLSNRKLLKEIYPDFCTWVKTNNYNYINFRIMAEDLYKYLISREIYNADLCKKVVNCLDDVAYERNGINFEDRVYVLAFIISHFLNRYHRFQKMTMKLLEHSLLPIRTKSNLTTNILSIGSGPAPSLFAFSDLYNLIRKYGKEKYENFERLANLRFKTDYVEISNEFRAFLHGFIEFYIKKMTSLGLSKENIIKLRPIPFHKGSFYNAFDFINEKSLIRSYTRRFWFEYNIIILSYFITTTENLESLIENNILTNLCYSLKSSGLIIFVGARGHEDIYNKINSSINSNYFHKFRMKKVIYEPMDYNYSNKYGVQIMFFNQKILDFFATMSNDYVIPLNDLKLYKTTQNKKPPPSKWQLLVYQKEGHQHY